LRDDKNKDVVKQKHSESAVGIPAPQQKKQKFRALGQAVRIEIRSEKDEEEK
jgi:hypothetical protein